MFLDADPDCGLHLLDKNNQQSYQESIEFIREPTVLFYLQTENMDETTYDVPMGYDLWYQKLKHVQHRDIKQTIQHAIEL